ncbi:nitroreductase [Pontibacter sp. JAM-7]|uniref:nitroreductase family protein n=1 Tax=Pontibacter sp. JAM-7 TaxID=3366581 RepID=UPI003AF6B710
MDALSLLHERVSMPLLEAPGPTSEQLEQIFTAAVRAPDHGALKPWRFLLIEGEDRAALGELFTQAALSDNPDLPAERRQKTAGKPLRAPCIVVVIAKAVEHAKVPVLEQQISAGCCAQNMILAAHALGLGAMWRTGSMAYHPTVHQGLGLVPEESIIGYVYFGTPVRQRRVPKLETSKFVARWPESDND